MQHCFPELRLLPRVLSKSEAFHVKLLNLRHLGAEIHCRSFGLDDPGGPNLLLVP
jgi:hypothetical protein